MDNRQTNNLTGQAYRILTKKIIHADYQPGQKISEKKVENDINIGRTPVREALLQLRQEKLLNVIPQSGTYISKIDMKEVLDARFARASIEQRIMRNVTAINLTATQQAHFREILDEQQRLMQANNIFQFLTSDDQFHRYFYEITDHIRIWEWLKKINIQFDRFRFLRLKVEGLSWEGLIEDHEAILKAVITKDINEVERLTANHMHRTLTEESKLIKNFPDYFTNYQKTK
ncbi:GntR family transcriptional regulator [Limosilactobacillus kribbianus]|uniref:GntR family transcriptional regulator n=1 Tax=Limosilactobacillus kribbianus TaxID=2982695 RepID=UPI002264EFD4|nr:GntR family transcriptional regulator [Limosilactobacillus kribbianus]